MNHPTQYLIPIFTMFVVGGGIALIMLVLSSALGPKKFNRAKHMVYECGIDPTGPTRERISIKYYLVAILFLLFDLEAAFLIPLALSWNSLSSVGVVALGVLGFFMLFFILSIWYDYKAEALEWER